jgi:hypothetical protein
MPLLKSQISNLKSLFLLFPFGLAAPIGASRWNSKVAAYGTIIVGWSLYLALSIHGLRQQRARYFRIYAILLVLLALNVAGCRYEVAHIQLGRWHAHQLPGMKKGLPFPLAPRHFTSNILLVMRSLFLTFASMAFVCLQPAIAAGTFDLKPTALSGGRLLVLATNIPSGIRGYCVWESSSNLVTWTPVLTNLVNKTWSTNTFATTTNSMRFFRAWVY